MEDSINYDIRLEITPPDEPRAECVLLQKRILNRYSSKPIDMKVTWNNDTKTFHVEYRLPSSTKTDSIKELGFSLPLEVAKHSTCDCGGTLQLGHHTIITERRDFTFEGEFYCPECKRKRIGNKSGIRKFIEQFFRTITKLEIKPIGVIIEKDTENI